MKRLLPFIVLILLFLGLLAAVPVLLQPDRRRQALADDLTRRLGRRVIIARIGAGLFPPSLRLHNVTVSDREDEILLLQAGQVQANLALTSLLRLRLEPKSLIVSRSTLTLRRQLNGSWDLARRSEAVSALAGGGWPLQRVVWRDGECRLVDPFQGRELVLQNLEGAVEAGRRTARLEGILAGSSVPVPFTLEGRRDPGEADGWLADLRLADDGRQWILQMTTRGGVLDIQGQSPEWRLDHAAGLLRFYGRLGGVTSSGGREPPRLKDWRTRFTADSGRLSFYHAARLGTGLSEAKGEIVTRALDRAVSARGTAQDVALEDLEPLIGPWGIEGRLSALVPDFQVVLGSSPWSTVRGKASLDIEDGRYRFPEASLRGVARAKTTAYLKAKFPGMSGRGLPFRHFTGQLDALGGQVALRQGRVSAPDMTAGLTGHFDPARGGMDLFIRLQIAETSPALLRLLPGRYVSGAPGRERVQPIYGRLQGTWEEWLLRALPAGKVPPAVQARLRQAIR